MISFLLNTVSSLTAMIHSLLLMMSRRSIGILPSKPVEYCERTRNMFFASCCVMVEAPRPL